MDATDSSSRLGQPSRSVPSSSSNALPSSSTAPAYQQARPQFPRLFSDEMLYNEKVTPDALKESRHPLAIPLAPSIPPHSSRPQYPQSPRRMPIPSSSSTSRSASSIAYSRPRGLRIVNLLKPWTPIILYAITTFGFLAAIAFYKAEVFGGESSRCRRTAIY